MGQTVHGGEFAGGVEAVAEGFEVMDVLFDFADDAQQLFLGVCAIKGDVHAGVHGLEPDVEQGLAVGGCFSDMLHGVLWGHGFSL